MLTKALVMDEGWHVVWPNAQLWVIAPTGSALIWFNVVLRRAPRRLWA